MYLYQQLEMKMTYTNVQNLVVIELSCQSVVEGNIFNDIIKEHQHAKSVSTVVENLTLQIKTFTSMKEPVNGIQTGK